MKGLVLRGFSLDIADVRILGFYSQVNYKLSFIVKSTEVRWTRMRLYPPQSWFDSSGVLGIKHRSTLAGQVSRLLYYSSSPCYLRTQNQTGD